MPPRKPRTNLAAVEATIRAIKANLGREHDALVELCRSLARAVDSDPCPDCGTVRVAAVWKEYRASVEALTRAGASDDVDDDTKTFRVLVQTPVRAQVRHSEDD